MVSKTVLAAPELGTAHGFATRHGQLSDVLSSPLARLRQVHGADVLLIDASTELRAFESTAIEDRPAGDALITQQHGVTLVIATADCLPVLAFDVETGSIGAAHAGWRGIALGVLPAMLGSMAREFGAQPRNCAVALGPCIGAAAYRVGQDVVTSFRAAGVPMTVFGQPREQADTDASSDRTWLCDLARAARYQVEACGIEPSRVYTIGRCTYSESDSFHSYRRDGDVAGRMLSGISLTPRTGNLGQ